VRVSTCVIGLRALLEGFDPIAVLARDDVDAGALGERRHDLAGEAEDGGLVRRAMADDERAAAVRQRVENAAERGAEPLRVFCDDLGSASRSASSAPLPAFW
jgi:hypothetical protein